MSTVDEGTLQEWMRTIRRELHQYPEVSFQEFKTTERIRGILLENDIEILETNLATGVLAIVRGKYPGDCIAVRADIDALPILEQTELSFASERPGTMHACGHDFHTSAVLGAAILAKAQADTEESFSGSILFVFQPAEEIGSGAAEVWATGVLQAQGVTAIIGEHNQPRLESGKIGVRSGPLMASVDEFVVRVKGVGGHAAIPELTVDPIAIASQIIAGLQHIVSRNVAPLDAVVVTVGSFHAGTARNVIPMEAVFEGTVRCLAPSARQLVERRFHEYVLQTAAAYGATAEIEYSHVLSAVVNEHSISELVREVAMEVTGRENVVEAVPSLGGEDFSHYLEQIPGTFFWVGTGKSDNSSYGWHHPSFDVDEDMLLVAARIFAQSAFTYLSR